VTFIWATRGREWGFRFLRDAGLGDPLPDYDAGFAGTDGSATVCHRVGGVVAVRFPDPLGRRDSSGRVIPHEFVIFPPLSDGIHSVEDALEHIWPLVADEYQRTWDI
jgi:hypothetical protein